jgi:hypothetical protein
VELTRFVRRGGLQEMRADRKEFERRATAVVARFLMQNGKMPQLDQLELFARRLGDLVTGRGLPMPLAAGDCGAPGGIPDDECTALVDRVVEPGGDPLLTDAARQLVKACFYPEFTQCRDSFRETGRDGSCRRQELARVKGRTSGTHCVDCPHWVSLAPETHAAFLEREWKKGADDFRANQTIFLPEDFRALRQWLHAAARLPR